MHPIRASLTVLFVLMLVACASSCSSGPVVGSDAFPPTVQCKQKAGADTDKDCVGATGKPRKLDCDASETQSAVAAGCTPTKPGDSDVCCPTTVTGIIEHAPSTTTVQCKQKAGSDTDKDCVGVSGRPRKLDCDASETQSAVAAGCTPTKPGDSDVCCPTTVSGIAPDAG